MTNSDNTNYSAGMSSDSKEYLETHPVRREIVRVYNPRVTAASAVSELKQKLGNVSSLKTALDVLSSALDETTQNFVVSDVQGSHADVPSVEDTSDDADYENREEYPLSTMPIDVKTNVTDVDVAKDGFDITDIGVLTKKDLVRGIVVSEILGPPRSRVTGRRGKF